jgi:hypothetical protein
LRESEKDKNRRIAPKGAGCFEVYEQQWNPFRTLCSYRKMLMGPREHIVMYFARMQTLFIWSNVNLKCSVPVSSSM